MKFLEQLNRLLTSKKWSITLFALLCIILIPRALLPEKNSYVNTLATIILVLIAISLFLCTLHKYRSLKKSTLIIHIGSLVTLAGSFLSLLGFVATQNLHEGSSTETAYRWDVEKDSPLGFTLELTTIHREFFPVEIRIGVLKDSVKHGLFQTRTGKKFATDDIFVLPEQIDFDTKNLELRVFDKEGNELGNFSTATGLNTLPKNFPYSFKLVSYKDPTLKRIWVDLKIHRDGKRITQGASEVNHPFKWNDLNFYLTKVDLDQYGYPYAGLQIVKDPSVPVVFTGFGIICLGLACCLFSKHMKKNG